MMAERERGPHIAERPSIFMVAAYFVRLGTFGFGGPIALAGHMQRDLVERRNWLSQEEYLDGLALAQLAPGPLAAQLAMYIGYVLHRVFGATVVGIAFIAPSFLLVLALAEAYIRYGGLPWMQEVFYGVGAAVIGIILRSSVKLMKSALKHDPLLWSICIVLAITTAISEREILSLFVGGGVLVLVVRSVRGKSQAFAFAALPFVATRYPETGKFLSVFGFFAKAGLFVFGSGLAIVPFLHGGVVLQHHWLSERQFLDAVAVAMITPGPVVITVAFIGFLVSGVSGAVAAALGVFVPVYLVVVFCTPLYRRYSRNSHLHDFVQGVTAGAVGAITGAVFVLGRRSIHDRTTAAIAICTIALLLKFRIPEPLLICGAALIGILSGRS